MSSLPRRAESSVETYQTPHYHKRQNSQHRPRELPCGREFLQSLEVAADLVQQRGHLLSRRPPIILPCVLAMHPDKVP